MVKTKIVCTIGPASGNVTLLRKMMLAGMDVVRLNFSHGSHSEQRQRIDLIRQLNKKYRRSIKILQDLEGFRIRIGSLNDHRPIELKKRQSLWLARGNEVGRDDCVSFDYKGSLSGLKVGQHIYIDDGNIVLTIKKQEKKRLKAEVVIGGVLKEHKGINIPEAKLHFPGMTKKDRDDIRFGIEQRVDYIAQSFIMTKKDVLAVRELVKRGLPDCAVIAKIETREGIRNIDEIIEASDGIMIARGDMGVSIPIYEVPIVQKMIIKKCNRQGKFVITATQMLESMVENIRPTRAEVADVANAILDGTDFIMLSAESAVGRYPVEAVKMMNDIIKFTERSAQNLKTISF